MGISRSVHTFGMAAIRPAIGAKHRELCRASKHSAGDILKRQKVLGTFEYSPKPSVRGYTGEILRVDIYEPSFRIIPVTEKMKEVFTGERDSTSG